MKNSTKYIIIGASVLALGLSAYFVFKKPKPPKPESPNNTNPNTNNINQGGGGFIPGAPDGYSDILVDGDYTNDDKDETNFDDIEYICRYDSDNPICGN
jgi:hypothetical protein